VDSGQLRRVRPTIYQTADLSGLSIFERRRWLHAAPAIAAALTTPGAMASHSTAAVLRGLPLAFVPRRACASVTPLHTGDIPGVHLHRTTGEMFVPAVGSVPCHSVDRTLVDLAREHGVTAAVVPMDFALRNQLVTADSLERLLLHAFRWPGVKAARIAAAGADPRSESPLESRSRLKFARFGIPMPQLQVEMGGEHGRFIGRVDFLWPEAGVVGEVDGAVKYTEDQPNSLVEEKRRQELLERTGLIVVRWGASDLRRFGDVAERLQHALARGRQRPNRDRRWSVLNGVAPTL
jgi:very-short-patch-repair endonuclease